MIAIAADHGGYALKSALIDFFKQQDIPFLDLGTSSPESVDYPDYAKKLAECLHEKRAQRGILICGTGIGISIAANRYAWIRAALCHDVTTARLSRQHNDANVLALGARVVGFEVAKDCVTTFLSTPFEGGRHALRVGKMTPSCDGSVCS